MDNNEVKSAVETLGKTFESFKNANDEKRRSVPTNFDACKTKIKKYQRPGLNWGPSVC